MLKKFLVGIIMFIGTFFISGIVLLIIASVLFVPNGSPMKDYQSLLIGIVSLIVAILSIYVGNRFLFKESQDKNPKRTVSTIYKLALFIPAIILSYFSYGNLSVIIGFILSPDIRCISSEKMLAADQLRKIVLYLSLGIFLLYSMFFVYYLFVKKKHPIKQFIFYCILLFILWVVTNPMVQILSIHILDECGIPRFN